MKNKGVIVLAVLLALTLCASSIVNRFSYTTTEYALDTMCTITAYGWNSKTAVTKAVDALKSFEEKISVHRNDSEISLLNRRVKIATRDEDIFNMIKTAKMVSKDTNGAFDITVKPLVDLWNIKGGGPVPNNEEITNRLSSISNADVQVDLEKRDVFFANSDTKIDLGGIAKGYVADVISDILVQNGINSAIIDLGGNVRTIGKKKGKVWRIGIQDPDSVRGEYFGILDISDKCVVTSGAYERYFIEDGKKYHHIIDPRTGYPADSDITSVSIIADDGAKADALSTAVYVMGLEKGVELLNSDKYKDIGYIITDNNHRVYVSENIDFEITNDKYKG